MTPVLEVRDLVTRFHTEQGIVHAVNGISYSLEAGEALAIVGESGSGKTVSALSIMGLLPTPSGEVARGRAILSGRDLFGLSPADWRRVRGREITMVFQDPMTSLNPVLTVGYQLTEGLRKHLRIDRQEAKKQAAEMLGLVGIPNPRGRLTDYPHQFSGGQRQRLMIAMALSCKPSVVIADEPTTALDVTIQAQIVDLIRELQQKLGMSILWITHDLALVAGLADRVAVMYAGYIVETASVRAIFEEPRHPYTLGLLRSIPRMDGQEGERLESIPGQPPDLRDLIAGCPFAPRCPHVVTKCQKERPPLQPSGPQHENACWQWRELGQAAGGERGP